MIVDTLEPFPYFEQEMVIVQNAHIVGRLHGMELWKHGNRIWEYGHALSCGLTSKP